MLFILLEKNNYSVIKMVRYNSSKSSGSSSKSSSSNISSNGINKKEILLNDYFPSRYYTLGFLVNFHIQSSQQKYQRDT